MRQTLFRAWLIEEKEMIPVYQIDFERKMINTDSAWRMFSEIHLMQYTGFKDKNDQKIFEGDILRFIHGFNGVGIVTLFQGSWSVLDDFEEGNLLNLLLAGLIGINPVVEVVGNVHDNPELLINL